MPTILTLATFALALGVAAPALAHGRPVARTAHPIAVIERSYARGELTAHERQKLLRLQRRIAQLERRARADGFLTPHEARRIAALKRAAHRQLVREQNDLQRRW